MAEILLGSDSNPGGRKYNEDRSAVDHFVTRSGLRLDVAVVCDGVGGEERGERAASSPWIRPARAAHQPGSPDHPADHDGRAGRQRGGLCRGRAPAGPADHGLHHGVGPDRRREVLHVANVGDSRIYLSRGGALQQLTRDHTFANVMVWLGKLTPEAAASNPDADKVMRALGVNAALQSTRGFIWHTDYGEANLHGRAGLPLQTGDSVLLCSDGLVKHAPRRAALVTAARSPHAADV